MTVIITSCVSRSRQSFNLKMSSLLFTSTILCFSGYLTPTVIKYLTTTFFSENKSGRVQRDEMRKLEQEMSGISLVNEFARFTRLQRKHTKLKDELRNNVSARLSSRNRTQLYLTYGNKLLTIIISLALVYMYGKEPVVILPQSLLWPFQDLMSWPSAQKGAISLTTWMVLTRLVVDACKQDSP